MNTETLQKSAPTPALAGVCILDPTKLKIFTGTFGLMHVQVEDPDWEGERLYRAVHAALAFPISQPNRFVSLRYFDEAGRDCEIGIIETPEQLAPECLKTLQVSLARTYYEQVITGIQSVEMRFNMLFFKVVTQHGERAFQMQWRHERTQDYGEFGKVLLDVYGNRYVIPNIKSLPKNDQAALTRYIYW